MAKQEDKSYSQLVREYNAECKGLADAIKSGENDPYGNSNEIARYIVKCANLTKILKGMAPTEELRRQFEGYYKDYCAEAARRGSTLQTDIPETTMDDVKGLEDVKAKVESFLYLLENEDIRKSYAINSGLGMLMYGPPGTGKTMFAEAIANRLQMPFFTMNPSDVSKRYVGDSENAVKQKFDELEVCENGAVLFIDECESIFGKRREDAQKHEIAVTNEILQRMNGFGVNGQRRVIIAATNCPWLIDPAYLRYKRFSHIVHIHLPDADARRAMIESRLKKLPPMYDNEEIVNKLTEWTDKYYSGADICGIIENAVYLVLERLRNRNSTVAEPVSLSDFETAFRNYRRSISPGMLKQFDDFEAHN